MTSLKTYKVFLSIVMTNHVAQEGMMTFLDKWFGCFHDWYGYTSEEMGWYKVNVCLKCGEVHDWRRRQKDYMDAREAKARAAMAGREHLYGKRSGSE